MVAFTYDDGGRRAAGFKGPAGDCCARAIAIATTEDYRTIYDRLNELAKSERTGKRKRGRSSARAGVYTSTMHRYMKSIGWAWTPTMQIGSGCKVHARADELPSGRLILNLSRHFAAFVNGALHDTYDCSRDGTRCVYGYWSNPST